MLPKSSVFRRCRWLCRPVDTLLFVKTAGLLFLQVTHAVCRETTPLVLFPPQSEAQPVMVVYYSGDGGYNATGRGIGRELSGKGIGVVGVNSLRYFFTARTPAGASNDLAGIIRRYSAEWHARSCVVSGFSFGADAIGFLVRGLPDSLRRTVRLVICLAPGHYADFRFTLKSWFGIADSRDYPVVDCLRLLAADIPVVCFYGRSDSWSCGPVLQNDARIETHILDRGHRIGRHYEPIVKLLVARCRAIAAESADLGSAGHDVHRSGTAGSRQKTENRTDSGGRE